MDEDQHLLQLYAGSGDEEALGRLRDWHSGWVRSLCLRILHDAALAEDATQAVFVLLVRKAGGMCPTSAVAGWLHRAATHVAREIKRAESRRLHHEAQAARQGPHDSR